MKKIFALCLFLMVIPVLNAKNFDWSFDNINGLLVATLSVDSGCTVYPESVLFTVLDSTGAPATAVVKPEKRKIYGEGKWQWHFSGKAPFTGNVSFQGCGKSSSGSDICFPPDVAEINISRSVEKEHSLQNGVITDFKVVKKASGYMSKEDFLAFAGKSTAEDLSVKTASLIVIFLLALLGGAGLNLTPCVLPMIPINLAIIGAAGQGKKTGFIRGLCYGAGIACAYGILGLLVILTGMPFGSLNSSWVFNLSIAVIFFILSAAMAGFVNLDFSRFRRFNAADISGRKEFIAFVMGAVAALLAGACVAPVVVTVLLFAASEYSSGNFYAVFLPFVLGIGMAIPWPFAGAGIAIIPKPTGRIMNTVKVLFVVFIVITGIYYLYNAIILMPGKYDSKKEFAALNNAIAESRKSGKPVMIDFWAPWCKNCSAMERNVLNTPEVKQALGNYIFVKFNAGNLNDINVAGVLTKCGVTGLPSYVVITPAQMR